MTRTIRNAMFEFLRMAQFGVFALIAFLLLKKPELQGEVILYKAVLIMGAAHLGYWIDRCLFPYARPHLAVTAEVGNAAMVRRAIIVAAVIVGFALAL